jgi:hypothetical protein
MLVLEKAPKKGHKYLYFDQLLFLLPSMQDYKTESNLSSLRNENEDKEESNTPEEGRMVVPQNVQQKKGIKVSFEKSLLKILQEKKA